jgi:hypothetical protein
MRDVMDLSGHQNSRLIIDASCSPDSSGLARAFAPSAFTFFSSVFFLDAARPFSDGAVILVRFICLLVDRGVGVFSRPLIESRAVNFIIRRSLPLWDSINALLMRPLNGPVSRIVFCSSLA